VEKSVSSRGGVISYEFIITALLILFWGSVGLNRIGIGVIAPYIKPEFGLSNFQIGLLVSGITATWALSSWGGGWLSDRYGRRAVLLPGAILICVMTASMGIAGGFWSMFIIREFLGVGDGIGWSVGQATVYEESAPQRRAVNQALVSAGYTLIGAGLGALIITRISSNLGWRWAFPIIAAATAVVVAALWSCAIARLRLLRKRLIGVPQSDCCGAALSSY
jgi:MFS family permease